MGRTENGIAQAIKPKLKFDNAGIGHDAAEQFTNSWWERAYNSANNNIEVSSYLMKFIHVPEARNPKRTSFLQKLFKKHFGRIYEVTIVLTNAF